MPIEIHCPNCARKYSVAEKHIGKRVVCADAACGTRFVANVKPTEALLVGEVFFEAADNSTAAEDAPETTHQTIASPRENDIAAPSSEFSQDESDGANEDNSQNELAIETTEQNKKQFWGLAKKVIGDASAHVSNAGIAMTTKAASLGSSGVAKVAEVGKQTFNAANNAIDSTGVKGAVKTTASVVSEKLDEVSGKRLIELVEKKLQLQDSYNDILATRLAEALDRIALLEDQIKKLTAQESSAPISTAEVQR